MAARDYHVHLHHSPCTADEMTAAAIFDVARATGLDEVGLVNHLHPDTDLGIFEWAGDEIAAAAERFGGRVLVGAELDLLDQTGATTFRDPIAERVDYISLGVGHYQLDWVTADFAQAPDAFLIRETTALIAAVRRHPIDVVVHPYIYVAFPKLAPHYVGALLPDRIPAALIDELAETLVVTGTCLEFHCRDIVVRPERLGGAPFVASYLALLETLRDKGVRFVAGSDAHRLNQIERVHAAPPWAQGRLPIHPSEREQNR